MAGGAPQSARRGVRPAARRGALLGAAVASALALRLRSSPRQGAAWQLASAPSQYELLQLAVLLAVALCALLPVFCCCCCVCNVLLVKRWVLRKVERHRTRCPCPWNRGCTNTSSKHLRRYSHPYDADYGYAVRVHGGVPEFCTLRQCFTYMDPEQRGYVSEHRALYELLRARAKAAKSEGRRGAQYFFLRKALDGMRRWSLRDWRELLALTSLTRKLVHDIWSVIDTDGNKYVSFPEFVEWATGPGGQEFFLPQHVGVVGQRGRSGQYRIPCTVGGCRCRSFGFGQAGEANGFCLDCGHHFGYHSASPKDQILAVIPMSWEARAEACRALEQLRQGPAGVLQLRRLVECDEATVRQVQRLMDASSLRRWTRDRGRRSKVPSGYEVVRVHRNENVRLWLKYVLKKALMIEAHDDLEPFEPHEMRTSEQAGALAETLVGSEPLDPAVNEWYLWHGASAKGALCIAGSEFKQSLAGSATGTLYGRGTYMSDSCTKADEYAKAEQASGDEYCLMLCRVMGGRVKYTDEPAPNAEALERDVLEGPFDCVLGDREKCRNTFKEIVIYESSQAYPEYLVYYRRLYADDDTA